MLSKAITFCLFSLVLFKVIKCIGPVDRRARDAEPLGGLLFYSSGNENLRLSLSRFTWNSIYLFLVVPFFRWQSYDGISSISLLRKLCGGKGINMVHVFGDDKMNREIGRFLHSDRLHEVFLYGGLFMTYFYIALHNVVGSN